MSFFSSGMLKAEGDKIVTRDGAVFAKKSSSLGVGSSSSEAGGGNGGYVQKQRSQSIYTRPSGLSGKANIIRQQLYGK